MYSTGVHILVGLLAGVAAGEADTSWRQPMGVIVVTPTDRMAPVEWQVLSQLKPFPEILGSAAGGENGAPYDFSGLERDLAAYHERGMAVSTTLTPHVHSVPWQPSVDEKGEEWRKRHNLFDPAFEAEWTRLHEEFVQRFRGDARLPRVYVAPPSYFGEIEYFMGDDWDHTRFLGYEPLAQTRFVEWLKAHYADPAAVGRAWGRPIAAWEEATAAKPHRDAAGLHTETDWLDFMAFRSDYLATAVARQADLLAGYGGEVGLKFSIGDYTATQGTNSALTLSLCQARKQIALHTTNGHSVSDQMYGAALVARYGLACRVVENDGNRYGRTEVARIALVSLMTGSDSFNFAYDGHLLGKSNMMTETARALVDARALLGRYALSPQPREVAFLHSNTTDFVRAPNYRNRDVSHVYDASLSNCGQPDARGYRWGRWLDLPGVTGEQAVLDGDLEGRRIVIVPNTGATAFPTAVRERVLAWVEEGGALVVFGADGFAYAVDAPGASDGPRCHRDAAWAFPGTVASQGAVTVAAEGTALFGEGLGGLAACPVWGEAVPAGWTPVLADGAGHAAAVVKPLGKGTLLLFAGPVPAVDDLGQDPFYSVAAPRLLRAFALSRGWRPSCEVRNVSDEVATPLALAYAGKDRRTGRHVFVGGAFDESMPRVRFTPRADLTGPAEIVLVDLHGVKACYADGEPLAVEDTRPVQFDLYKDPTALEGAVHSIIPWCVIPFESPRAVVLSLGPAPACAPATAPGGQGA